MSLFWDERYSSPGFAYGKEPNLFLKSRLQFLTPGKILFPGEGEGRNAVFAAQLRWEVHAFDSSSVAAGKAAELSSSKNVTIHYKVADVNEIQYEENTFDCIALIFVHLPSELRVTFHRKMLSLLKPGGLLLLESFSKKQLERKTGGPRNMSMLHSRVELQCDFSLASKLEINETDAELNEGVYHQGLASLIRVIAVK